MKLLIIHSDTVTCTFCDSIDDAVALAKLAADLDYQSKFFLVSDAGTRVTRLVLTTDSFQLSDI